ncbi:hypothetical protein Tco_1434030 [Tanacetum coccineum]
MDKGKGKMVETEKPVKLSRKEHISFDDQEARRLQALFDKESRIANEEAQRNKEANLARLQQQEQEELTDAEKAKLFVQLLEARKKHFAAKRAEEQRSKPLTKAQKRKTKSTYLKNMADMVSDVLEGSSKRAGSELEQETKKKQKTDDDEIAKLKMLVDITPDDEEVAVDAIPLASKPPVIVDYMIYKEERTSYYKITRTDGSFMLYKVFSQLLKRFDREDLETLWKLVKAKHGDSRPSEGYERVLWGDLKVMFEPHVEDLVWRELRQGKVLIWKLFDSRGVNLVRFLNMQIYMLVEKMYPLKPPTLSNMLNKKLQADHHNEMCYQFLKLIIRQLHNE